MQIEIKRKLLQDCKTHVNNRLQTVEEIIASNQKALQSETKSSAGDKHETGRAMLQLEMEKAGQQLAGIQQMKTILSKIDVSNRSKTAHLGSVIETDQINYFLSVSVGKMNVSNKDFFAISVVSPIGKLLLGKQNNDEFVFNGIKIKITNIY